MELATLSRFHCFQTLVVVSDKRRLILIGQLGRHPFRKHMSKNRPGDTRTRDYRPMLPFRSQQIHDSALEMVTEVAVTPIRS